MRNSRKQNCSNLDKFTIVVNTFIYGIGFYWVQFIYSIKFITLMKIKNIENPVTYIKIIFPY